MTEEDLRQGQESSVIHEFVVTGSKPPTKIFPVSSRNTNTIHESCTYQCSNPTVYIGKYNPACGPDPAENLLKFLFPESEVGR